MFEDRSDVCYGIDKEECFVALAPLNFDVAIDLVTIDNVCSLDVGIVGLLQTYNQRIYAFPNCINLLYSI